DALQELELAQLPHGGRRGGSLGVADAEGTAATGAKHLIAVVGQLNRVVAMRAAQAPRSVARGRFAARRAVYRGRRRRRGIGPFLGRRLRSGAAERMLTHGRTPVRDEALIVVPSAVGCKRNNERRREAIRARVELEEGQGTRVR